jgi:ribosomal protein S18 acetylase RimI-like enzyme
VSPFHISFMEHNDIRESANVLSHAMLNNPLHLAVYQGNSESERSAIERMFLELFHERPGIVFIAKDCGKIIGVMRMNSCVGNKLVDGSYDIKDLQDVKSRQAYWLSEWAKRDPREQHWHLGPIGVLSSHRGLGIGRKLMERFCNEVDKCSATAYLETDLDVNVIFYRKFGFEVLSKSTIFQVDNKYMFRHRTPIR